MSAYVHVYLRRIGNLVFNDSVHNLMVRTVLYSAPLFIDVVKHFGHVSSVGWGPIRVVWNEIYCYC